MEDKDQPNEQTAAPDLDQSVSEEFNEGYTAGFHEGVNEGKEWCEKVLTATSPEQRAPLIEYGKIRSSSPEKERGDAQSDFIKGYRVGITNGFKESFQPCSEIFSNDYEIIDPAEASLPWEEIPDYGMTEWEEEP